MASSANPPLHSLHVHPGPRQGLGGAHGQAQPDGTPGPTYSSLRSKTKVVGITIKGQRKRISPFHLLHSKARPNCCVTSGKLLNCSEPQFSLQMGASTKRQERETAENWLPGAVRALLLLLVSCFNAEHHRQCDASLFPFETFP